jgi:hypothetical protein
MKIKTSKKNKHLTQKTKTKQKTEKKKKTKRNKQIIKSKNKINNTTTKKPKINKRRIVKYTF